MLGIYISIFIILANILFICAIYSCIKVAVLIQSIFSHVKIPVCVLGLHLRLVSLVRLYVALSGCDANGLQEDRAVSHQQHAGGSVHHNPRLHLCLRQYGTKAQHRNTQAVHARIDTRTHAHTHTHTHTKTHTHTLTHMCSHTNTHRCSHAHTYKNTHARSHTRSHTNTHTHTHKHTHPHTQTHTPTHMLTRTHIL